MNTKSTIKIASLILISYMLCCCSPAARFTNSTSKAASTNTKRYENGSSVALPHKRDTKYPVLNGIAQAAPAFRGYASYYHDKFDGRTTASGEVFNQRLLTAAHKTLPFGTMVRVTNLKNNRQTVVKINDRGPFVAGRIIDLSLAAAKELDMLADGVIEVTIEVLN